MQNMAGRHAEHDAGHAEHELKGAQNMEGAMQSMTGEDAEHGARLV